MTLKVDNKEYLSEGPDLVSANVDSERPTVCDKDRVDAFRRGWQQLIDYRLIEWGWSSDQFDEEGVEPPSRETITRAIKLAQRFRSKGFPPPDSVVPDPNGGIVFERRELDITEVLHIWSDGSAEYQQFQGTRLVERTPL